MTLHLGLARARVGPAAALIEPPASVAACEENRLTRARQAQTTGPPELATAELLSYLGRTESDIGTVAVVAERGDEWWRAHGAARAAIVDVDPHRAHAEYALGASGFEAAAVLVCDAMTAEGYSTFARQSSSLDQIDTIGRFPIAQIYGDLTEALGLHRSRDEHLVEAMARAGDADAASTLADSITVGPEGISVAGDFQRRVCEHSKDEAARLNAAAAVQNKLGKCLGELLRRVATASRSGRVCLSGGLFFNTHFTTVAASSGAFEETFVPPHPGRNGCALGAALTVAGSAPAAVASPYLGPGYSDPQVKEALENCKLAFDLQHEDKVIETVIRAVSRGRLVGWYHGRLEWGPRALGHRTVLADPFAPHVLDNLNGYLKKRPAYRTYGVSVPLTRLNEFFEGERASPFMQYEYRPRDPEKFRSFLPEGVKTLRVHTVDAMTPRYLRLLERWGEMSGAPVLVNTSFNGFHEPLVCSPRDAIRVFYGTGLDLLALEDFILRK